VDQQWLFFVICFTFFNNDIFNLLNTSFVGLSKLAKTYLSGFLRLMMKLFGDRNLSIVLFVPPGQFVAAHDQAVKLTASLFNVLERTAVLHVVVHNIE
jgi:hypothetical protein